MGLSFIKKIVSYIQILKTLIWGLSQVIYYLVFSHFLLFLLSTFLINEISVEEIINYIGSLNCWEFALRLVCCLCILKELKRMLIYIKRMLIYIRSFSFTNILTSCVRILKTLIWDLLQAIYQLVLCCIYAVFYMVLRVLIEIYIGERVDYVCSLNFWEFAPILVWIYIYFLFFKGIFNVRTNYSNTAIQRKVITGSTTDEDTTIQQYRYPKNNWEDDTNHYNYVNDLQKDNNWEDDTITTNNTDIHHTRELITGYTTDDTITTLYRNPANPRLRRYRCRYDIDIPNSHTITTRRRGREVMYGYTTDDTKTTLYRNPAKSVHKGTTYFSKKQKNKKRED
jgi:hypothetical protein